jgi:Lytic transglycolase
MMTLGTALPRTVACTFTILYVVSLMIGGHAEAKAPGATYCFYKTCHRVKSLSETRALIGQPHTLPTSFYDSCKSDPYNPCGLTSSGEVFRPNDADNAASPIYPDGTTLLVWAPSTQQAAVLRVNNAGPYWGDRKLDVSRAAAEKLGFKGRGVADLKVQVLSSPSKMEATYRYKRNYQPVLGHIGRFASLDAAALAVNAIQRSSPLLAQGEEAVLLAILRPSLKAWPVVGQTMKQLAIAKSKSMPWPVLTNVVMKAKPPVGIGKTVAIAWPVIRAAPRQIAVRTASPAKAVTLAVVAQKTARLPRRALTWSQQVAQAKQRRLDTTAVSSTAKPLSAGTKVALSRVRPSRGLALALRAEEAAAKAKLISKNAKIRASRQAAPNGKRPAGKAVDARKRVVKVSFAEPNVGNAVARQAITGRSLTLPSQYAPTGTESKPQKPAPIQRLIV